MAAHHTFRVFDHVTPLVAGGTLTRTLPWDHITNMAWAVAGSVLSWAVVQGLAWAVRKKK